MRTSSSLLSTADLLYLSAMAINGLIHTLSKGTGYCIGTVLMVMMTDVAYERPPVP